MDTEDRHLLFCLNTDNEPSKAATLAQWSATEWKNMVQQSIKYGIAPYLYHRLKSLQPAAAIPTVAERLLKEMFLYSASVNMRLYHELGKVLAGLKNESIPVIVLKGAHLAELVYGNIALRTMGDVDLMVRKTDLTRTAKKLMRLGYKPQKQLMVESHCKVYPHIPPFSKAGAALIEVHHSIINLNGPFKIDINGLWQRAKPAQIAGFDVWVLSPEDFLLYLCLHTAYQHRFSSGLRALCDIIETLQSIGDKISPELVVKRAQQWKAMRCAFFTLHLTREMLGVNRTGKVLKVLETDLPESESVEWAKEQIFFNSASVMPMSPNLARLWKTRGVGGKAAAFLKYVFVSRNTMAALYSVPTTSKRIYFYYLKRIRDVFLRYGRTAWCLLFRPKKIMQIAVSENRGNMLEQWMTFEAGENMSTGFSVFTCYVLMK